MKTEKGFWKHVTILTLSVTLLLGTAAVSFAWMANGQTHIQKYWALVFGEGNDKASITVKDLDMDVKFWLYNEETEKYDREITNEEKLITVDGMMPSEAIYFMFEFENNTSEDSTVDISFVGMQETEGADTENGTPARLSDALYLSLSKSEGYDLSDNEQRKMVPENTYERMSDITTYTTNENNTTSGSMFFAENLKIPSTSKGENTVKIYGYILFDRNAGAEYENCTLSINKVYILG